MVVRDLRICRYKCSWCCQHKVEENYQTMFCQKDNEDSRESGSKRDDWITCGFVVKFGDPEILRGKRYEMKELSKHCPYKLEQAVL